jgi:Uma2 family endonuclease
MAIRQPQTRQITLEEFKALPEGPPYFEFEEGELIPVVSPNADHQEILSELLGAVRAYCRRTKVGRAYLELDVYLPDGRVFIPDITFLRSDKLDLLRESDKKIHGVPDLAVEITSSNQARDRSHKFHVYQANGVPWYWLIDSSASLVEEYELVGAGYFRVSTTEFSEDFAPKLFPGLSINLAQLLGLEEDEMSA